MASSCARPALGELDPNADFCQRLQVKRPPITWDRENEDAVLAGLSRGVYQWDEIVAVTDNMPLALSATAEAATQANEPALTDQMLTDPLPDDADIGFGIELQNEMDPNEIPSDDMGDEEVEEEMIEGEDEEEGDYDVEEANELPVEDQSPVTLFDPTSMGLKEINNLAHFGVSSHKPGNGVEELLSDDLDKYWQSDGQQPHILTMHFLRRVEIRAIRFYVDYHHDESYTPTNIVLYAGTGPHDLLQFAELMLASPSGWQDVPLVGCGGGADGNSLCCWIVQVHVRENHQNGKDTHIRGIRVFALDENAADGRVNTAVAEMVGNMDDATDRNLEREMQEDGFFTRTLNALAGSGSGGNQGDGGFSTVPDFMRDPEIR